MNALTFNRKSACSDEENDSDVIIEDEDEEDVEEKEVVKASKSTKKPRISPDEHIKMINEEMRLINQQIEESEENECKYFKIMSWNIDGLDQSNLQSRTKGVIATINK